MLALSVFSGHKTEKPTVLSAQVMGGTTGDLVRIPPAPKGRRILITGGTGTLGHALVKLLLCEHSPSQIIVLSRDEFKQGEMQREYPEVRYFIGDVRDYQRLVVAFNQVDCVIHTAAMKQVQKCQSDSVEAKKTNVDGIVNVIHAALECRVKRVVNISTYVSHWNIYGLTKSLAEHLVTQANIYGKTDTMFANVRLGNLVGARGSVIPIWREMVRHGDTISITGPDVRRFWVTIENAARLALLVLDDMQGGEVYVPKCGVLTMLELANMIAPNSQRIVTGPRPGDRADEELMTVDECQRAIDVGGHYIIPPLSVKHGDWTQRGTVVPAGFTYRTETWARKATREEILSNA